LLPRTLLRPARQDVPSVLLFNLLFVLGLIIVVIVICPLIIARHRWQGPFVEVLLVGIFFI
jgi:hypothetical protein